MITEFARKLLKEYPPVCLPYSRGWFRSEDKINWLRLKFASEVARQAGQKVDYLLCRHLSDLFWAVCTKNAELISLAIRDIFETLDHPEDRRETEECGELYALCYILLSIGRSRALSGDGRIYFYDEAKELIKATRYKEFFDLLVKLEEKAPGDALVFEVEKQINSFFFDMLGFEETEMVTILLQDLERPIGR